MTMWADLTFRFICRQLLYALAVACRTQSELICCSAVLATWCANAWHNTDGRAVDQSVQSVQFIVITICAYF